MTHKYRAKRTRVDEISFDSKKEANRYSELKLLRRAGDVSFFLRQPMFDLPGGVTYRADFLVVDRQGSVRIEDVKGFKTQVYKIKKKQVESLYPIKITEI